jgi:hypothetical protein
VGSDEDETSHDGKPERTTSRTNGTVTKEQLNLIKKLRTEKGMTPDEVTQLAMEMFKFPVTELNRTQASTLINALKVAKTDGVGAQPAEDIPF